MAMRERVLGVEGGGTKTAWVLLERDGETSRLLEQGKLPPTNLRLTSPERLRLIFEQLPREIHRAGVFLAGCVTDDDRRDLETLCLAVWPQAQIVTGSDRDSGLAAALENRDGIAVNAGTGSSVTGRRGMQIEKAGGWGHILGDVGGGYDLALQALRLVLREHDLRRDDARLAAEILSALCLNNFHELVRWAQAADKMEIATLAPTIFAAAEDGDERVREILRNGAVMLASYTHSIAQRLAFDAPQVRLLGGLFRCCEIYKRIFVDALMQLSPTAEVQLAKYSPEFAAGWLATRGDVQATASSRSASGNESSLASSTTEQPNPRSASLDRLSASELVTLFVDEEPAVEYALRACAAELTRAVEIVAEALRDGGRLFYVGAGTSGRLGVLDASEIPPTFGASPLLAQGIIAGGAAALHRSVEGAEDELRGGALAVEERGMQSGDIAFGITASGRTPFVLGAVERAKQLGGRTVLLTCNAAAVRCNSADLQINLPTGPEIIAGSTRLKAGTATKVALNIVSSGAMILLGKVRGNLMTDLAPTNTKLRDRAARVVSQLAQCSYDEAVARLTACEWNVRAALGER